MTWHTSSSYSTGSLGVATGKAAKTTSISRRNYNSAATRMLLFLLHTATHVNDTVTDHFADDGAKRGIFEHSTASPAISASVSKQYHHVSGVQTQAACKAGGVRKSKKTRTAEMQYVPLFYVLLILRIKRVREQLP